MACTAEELTTINREEELDLAWRRSDGSLRPFVTIWVVRAGDDVYARSAYGWENTWFQRALGAGEDQVRVAGIERDVAFEQPGSEADDLVTSAYHAKYDRHGARMVGTVVSPEAVRSTLRLVPR
jgi:hypothetical protein